MSKKSFTAAPRPKPLASEAIDAYVQGGAGHDTQPITQLAVSQDSPRSSTIKRLSIDLSEELHRRFKVACAATGQKMANELTVLIERRTAELEAEAHKR